MATLIQAASNLVNPLTEEGPDTQPKNCHEAVLGWLLTSLGYPRRWRLVRLAATRHGVQNLVNANLTQFQGDWMWQNIYSPRRQVSQATVLLAQPGDVLCAGAWGRPIHSMVVVSRAGNAVNIRGFNNAGTFLHLQPPPGYMQYDNRDRDVAAAENWNVSRRNPNQFGYAAQDLFLVKGLDARQNTARAFPWESSEFPVTTGNRWHYNPIQGWRWY